MENNNERRNNTRSYIIATLAKFESEAIIDDSIVLYFDKATNFSQFQTIGDWVLWASVFCPERVHKHKVVYESFGRLSYHRCYTLLRRQMRFYEELADSLPNITKNIRSNLPVNFMRNGIILNT